MVLSCVDATEPPIRMRTSQWGEEFCALKTALDPDGKTQQQKVIAAFLE
ncbi:MAG: hypothetical protein AAGF22_05690 [Pseudomonadota bacterium]